MSAPQPVRAPAEWRGTAPYVACVRLHRFLGALACLAIPAACSTRTQVRPPAEEGSAGATLASQGGVTTRRVWAGEGVDFSGTPSPDGRLLSYIDWNTDDLAVRDLATGKQRTLTHRFGSSFVWTSAFAPDGKRIAYGWYNDSTLSYELRVIDVDGAHAQVVEARKVSYYGPPRWSPDGRDIAVAAAREDGTWDLALVNVETGTRRTLKSFNKWVWLWNVAWSPDGRFLAYDYAPDENSRTNVIHLIAIDGSGESRVADGEAGSRVAGWTPDGDRLLFFSKRERTEGVWSVPVTDGRVRGTPTLVRRDLWESEPIGFTRNSLFYGVTTENRAVFVATIDVDRAQLVVAPAPYHSREFPGMAAEWSPDGRSIAYGIGNAGSTIGIRSVETGDVRVIPTPLDQTQRLVSWAPDGKSLLATGNQRGENGIFRIELRNGQTERVLSAPSGSYLYWAPEFSRDGRTLFYRRTVWKTRERALFARDLTTGVERVIACCGVLAARLSPDGRSVVVVASDMAKPESFARPGTIRIIPIAGGEGRVIYQARDSSEFLSLSGGLEWSIDGRHLIFVRFGGDLMVMPAEGGEPRRIFGPIKGRGIRLHPDGRRILFVGGSFKGEVWVMENLSSPPPGNVGPVK